MKITPEEIESLFPSLKYDLLLIGDGSGTIFESPCGFSCLSFDYNTKKIEHIYGGMSFGTNNIAELMPYITAIWKDFYQQNKFPRKVEIISDSEVSVKCGNKIYQKKANEILWKNFELFEESGYQIHWNHILRNTNEVSATMDKVAGLARKRLDKLEA